MHYTEWWETESIATDKLNYDNSDITKIRHSLVILQIRNTYCGNTIIKKNPFSASFIAIKTLHVVGIKMHFHTWPCKQIRTSLEIF